MKKLISKKGFSSGASTIISLSLVLFVVGLLAFVLINAKKVSDRMKESIVFTIMLQNNSENESVEISENKRLEFENYLKNTPYFKDVLFTNKEEAFENLVYLCFTPF